ncbi:MAG: tetratricopeptide repeat protein, partial [Treponema sp.]|nr:tetratricopeptide repeat protein [Treponema sp.]
MFKRNFVYYLLFIILLSSCSSAPRNPGDIDIIRAQAEHWLETGNKEATRGNFENALLILTEAKRQAVLVDDISLIVRVCLSKGNVLLSMGRTDEAFSQWERAVFEAELLGDRELLAVSKIFLIRGNLTSGREPPQTVLSEVIRESANLRSNRIFIAFAWQTRGLALRQLGSFREAEDAFMRSLDIHQRERNLENAAFDWFSIASIRSLAGNTGGAIEALQ